MGGDHLLKGGVQFARLYFDESDFDVQNNIYLLYSNGVPTSVREWNTPTVSKNIDKMLGLFVQDSWTVGRNLTLNLGLRFDHNVGILPEQSNPAGRSSRRAVHSRVDADQAEPVRLAHRPRRTTRWATARPR